jgi:hypothetical protein
MQCYEGKDFPGHDICQVQNTRDPKELFEICQFIPNAAGFNSFGWVKYYIPDNPSSLKDEQCNLYRISRPFVKLNGKLPEIWSATKREDVKEILKSHFETVQFSEEDLLKKLLTSNSESYLIMQDQFDLVDDFLEKLSHAMGQLSTTSEWDILSLSNSQPTQELDDYPKVLPIVGGLKGGFVISKSGAEKLMSGKPVRVVSTFPHLIKV